MYRQISTYFEKNIFSKCHWGFRKGHSAKHCLLLMIEKWKALLEQRKSFGASFTDLSGAFDNLLPGILIAKLNFGRKYLTSES